MRIRELAGLGVGVLLAGAATQVIGHLGTQTASRPPQNTPAIQQTMVQTDTPSPSNTTWAPIASHSVTPANPTRVPTANPCPANTVSPYPNCLKPLATAAVAYPPASSASGNPWAWVWPQHSEFGPPPDWGSHLPLDTFTSSGWEYFFPQAYKPFPARGRWAWVYVPMSHAYLMSYAWGPGQPPVGEVP